MDFENSKWLFFDLGYTLIDEHAAHEKRINDCIEYQRKRYGRIFTYEQIYKEMCRASADYRQQFYGAMEALGIEEKYRTPKRLKNRLKTPKRCWKRCLQNIPSASLQISRQGQRKG